VRQRSASAGLGPGSPLKNLIIDCADFLAWFCKARAVLWLKRSRWFDDAAEAIETGRSISEIRKEREGQSHDVD